MNKHEIRQRYQDCLMGYDTAILELKRLGFTEYAAEQFLYAVPDQGSMYELAREMGDF